MTATPDDVQHTPGAGLARVREVLGWPELPDDPEAEERYREENQRAQELAREYYARKKTACFPPLSPSLHSTRQRR
jgi:hypothetical protein